MAAITITATTFCIALTAAHSSPSNGASTIAWMTPPVTMLAVPIVSRMKPQKIEKCIAPARASRNMRDCAKPNWIVPHRRAATWSVGETGRAAANTRRWRAMTRAKKATAPQNTGNTSG